MTPFNVLTVAALPASGLLVCYTALPNREADPPAERQEVDQPADAPDFSPDGYRAHAPSEAWFRRLKLSHTGPLPIESYFFASPETICHPDDRTSVANPTEPPWNANCLLIITMADGSSALGTGWLAGPQLVVTAGHCVHEGAGGNFYRAVEVIPGASGSQRPFGSQVSTELRASMAWQTAGVMAADYGAILLNEPFSTNGVQPAFHTFEVTSNDQLQPSDALVAGYPGDKPFASQWKDTDPFSHLLPDQLRYRADTYPGESGSAVMHHERAVGIHNYGGCPNAATRITPAVAADLNQWLVESSHRCADSASGACNKPEEPTDQTLRVIQWKFNVAYVGGPFPNGHYVNYYTFRYSPSDANDPCDIDSEVGQVCVHDVVSDTQDGLPTCQFLGQEEQITEIRIDADSVRAVGSDTSDCTCP